MPLNGGGTASRVPGTTAVPNQTIKSADYNSEMDDVYNILNTARPIAYGGTGATNAADARTNLGIPESISSGEAFRGHLFGLTLSNNVTDATNDIDIGTGSAASDGTTPVVMTVASALTKRLDAVWAVGTGNGGLDTGSIANATYHVWLIQRSDTGVVDALFSTSATSPTMPANYDRKRRIGSVIRSGGAILAFTQRDKRFLLATPVDIRSDAVAAANSLQTMQVPDGLRVRPLISNLLLMNPSSDAAVRIGDGDATTAEHLIQRVQSSSGDAALADFVYTNTSRQIRYSATIATGTIFQNILRCFGWYDDLL